MILGDGNNLGDLGWGFKSIVSAAKSVGKGAVSVAKAPAAIGRRVANATAGVLCDKDGNPRGNDATSRNFCRAVKFKQEATLRRYLPQAAAVASRAAQAQKTAQAIHTAAMGGAGLGRFDPTPCSPRSRPLSVIRDVSGTHQWEFNTPRDRAMRVRCGVTESAAEWAEGRDLGDPDMNLLASLAGADINDLSFALAEVTPADMGTVFTPANAYLFGPALLAVGAGLYMAFRG
jgi:hypothetical protein